MKKVTGADTDMDWLSVYLYYYESCELFLKHGVEPFVRDQKQKNQILQFFFIRYKENGNHIRLRLKGKSDLLESKVKPELIAWFENYYRQLGYYQKVVEDDKCVRQVFIEFCRYEPETDRYAGEIGTTISERQFEASSNVAFSTLSLESENSYEISLGKGIQLHLGCVYAMGLTIYDAIDFFRYYFERWVNAAYGTYMAPDVDMKELHELRQRTIRLFEESYEKQSGHLQPLVHKIWEALNNEETFDQDWFNDWIVDMKDIRRSVLKAEKSNQLFHAFLSVSKGGGAAYDFFYLLDSYIHMTNNRLGISNRDEGYLAFLLFNSLSWSVGNK